MSCTLAPSPHGSSVQLNSEAMALEATGVHLGFCRQQLLDHGSVAFPSRPMQRRLASAMWPKVVD